MVVVAAVIVVVAAIATGAMLLWPRQTPTDVDGGGTGTANNDTEPAGAKEIVSIVSARSAFPFVQRWISQYNDKNSLGTVEIGYYLDKPGTPGDLAIVGKVDNPANASRVVPVSAQAVAIVYNIPSFPDVSSGLKLNASVLSQIFNGSITRWDHPAISSLNRNLNLPSEKIVIVHENSNDSSLALVNEYLATTGRITWPDSSIRAMGPDELAATIRTKPYSIGYVDFSYATQTRMTFAAIYIGGQYVLPSISSIDKAVKTGLQNTTDETGGTFAVINASRLDNSSYPVTGLYYAVPESNDNSNATQEFVNWLIDENSGQQILTEVQYPPIYKDGRLVMNEERALNSTTRDRASFLHSDQSLIIEFS